MADIGCNVPCYSPIKGYRSVLKNLNGNYPFTTNIKEGYADLPMTIPCGQCIGCRLEHSRQWALRCQHETLLHEENSFITLTYSPDKLESPSLQYEDFQLFMKRLRFHFVSKDPDKYQETYLDKHGNEKTRCTIRFYACGEYGTKRRRPHFHACIFGADFDDKEVFQIKKGIKLYKSETLEKLWKKGFCSIGNITFESAAYVARYATKKVKISKKTPQHLLDHYEVIDPLGEISELRPEFAKQSLKPAIGLGFIEQYHEDVYPKDFITLNNKKYRPPKYYDNWLKKHNLSLYQQIKYRRKNNTSDHDYFELSDAEQLKQMQVQRLVRQYEEEA